MIDTTNMLYCLIVIRERESALVYYHDMQCFVVHLLSPEDTEKTTK